MVKDCLKPLDGKDNEEDRYDSPAMKSGGKKDLGKEKRLFLRIE